MSEKFKPIAFIQQHALSINGKTVLEQLAKPNQCKTQPGQRGRTDQLCGAIHDAMENILLANQIDWEAAKFGNFSRIATLQKYADLEMFSSLIQQALIELAAEIADVVYGNLAEIDIAQSSRENPKEYLRYDDKPLQQLLELTKEELGFPTSEKN